MTTLILTDNEQALGTAQLVLAKYGNVEIMQSPGGQLPGLPRIDVRELVPRSYRLVLSLHCKQIFPPQLVQECRCVNVHPGLNPYNRGWFPHVFSLLNGLPAGVTIHEMDDEVDHGPVIVQKECPLFPWDTSDTAYGRLMALERVLLLEHFEDIRDGNYKATPSPSGGNINYRRDFEALREIDLREQGTFGEFLNRLRALTHGDYANAYFHDESGPRVFVRISLTASDD